MLINFLNILLGTRNQGSAVGTTAPVTQNGTDTALTNTGTESPETHSSETGKRAPRSTRGRAQNIVLGPTMAGGGVVRPRYVRRGAPISGRGRGRGQVSRGGLICPPDTNIVARGDGTTLQVGPLRPTWI